MDNPNPIRVLLIEDNEDDKIIAEHALSARSGYAMKWAPDFSSAWKLLNEEPCDVILLDLGLPDIQGTESVHKISVSFPKIPIVVLTGLNDEEQGLNAIHNGAQDYLVKGQVHASVIQRVIHFAIERKNALITKDHFMNILSHEIRTPLAALREILLMLSSQKNGAAGAQPEELIKMGLKTVDRMERTSSSLLALGKMEFGKETLKKTSFDMRELVSDIADIFEYPIQRKGLAARREIPQSPVEVAADSDKIAQVLINLINNACKYTQKGHIEIGLRDKGGEIECWVSDTGRGIDKQDIPRVFNKYEQFGKHDPGFEAGTGLGLSICREMILLHHGTIEVESVPGQGSRFTFRISKGTPERSAP